MVGELVGHYKILQKLGAGGMGEVYLADDTKLPRKVVLKFLPKDLRADANAKKRFQFEAQAIAALNHPNIITIHENDEYSGRNYFVMEFVDGGSLKERMSHFREIPDMQKKVKEIIIVAIQICRGLEKAHQANIIHRDIKPGNILLNTDGHIKIMDFGLAKLIGTDKLTKDKYTVGTGHYMSPEQISGKEIDHRTDIWSLGVVLYEILSGELPFSGDYIESLFYSILSEEVDPISKKIPSIPPEMERIINKCLEKDVKNRYASITEILTDLKQLKLDMDSGETITYGKRAQWVHTSHTWPGKLTIPAIIMALVILFFMVPNPGREAVKKWLGIIKIPDKKFLVVLPFANPGNDPTKQAYCTGTAERIITRLNSLESLHTNLWVTPSHQLKKHKVDSVKKACQAFAITLIITGNIQFNKDTITHTLQLWEAKRQKILKTKVIANATRNLSGLQVDLFIEIVKMLDIPLTDKTLAILKTFGTTRPGAYKFLLSGLGYLQENEDIKKIDQAIAQFGRATELDNVYLEAFQGLSDAYLLKYQLTQAKNWADKAIDYCNQTLKINERFWPAYRTMGMVHLEDKQYDPAIQNYLRSQQLNPDNFETCYQLGWAYFLSKKLNEAEDTFKRAIKVRPEYWQGYERLAYFFYHAGRIPEAIEMYHKVIELNPVNVNAYSNLMGIYIKKNDHEHVREIFERANKIGTYYKFYSNMGTSFFYQKKFAEAKDMYEKAIQLGAEDRRTWGNLADSYRYISGHEKRASQVYFQAIKITRQELESTPKNGLLRSSLALYLSKVGQYDQASLEMGKALELEPNNLEIISKSIVVFELSTRRDRALKSLREFVDRMGQTGELSRDPDLSDLRQDPRYQKLLKGKNSSPIRTKEDSQ